MQAPAGRRYPSPILGGPRGGWGGREPKQLYCWFREEWKGPPECEEASGKGPVPTPYPSLRASDTWCPEQPHPRPSGYTACGSRKKNELH